MSQAFDGSSGLVPGVTEAGLAPSVVTMGASTKLEILNDNKEGKLWFAINPSGSDFTAGAMGSQYIRAGEWLEVATTGSPVVVVKATTKMRFQVRKVA